MKKILAINTISILIVLVIWSVTTQIINAEEYSPSHNNMYGILGFVKESDKSEKISLANSDQFSHELEDKIEPPKDDFSVVLDDNGFGGLKILEEYEGTYGKVDESSVTVDPDMIYHNAFLELPLYAEDYYWRKYENAVAGVVQLNTMPILTPGDSIAVIGDRYIDIKVYNGYLRPAYGYNFASGVCWSTTALGIMMDEANKDFIAEYQIPLFTFNKNDRAPHSGYYRSYLGHGYTILQKSTGVAVQDFKFTLNPDINNHPELDGFKAKIVLIATSEHPTASHGQSIGAFIISNYEF